MRMDTSWWLALVAVVLLALVASVVDGWGRGGRPGRRARRTAARPVSAEIWWAEVPHEDGAGGRDRPCLVLGVRGERVTVARITTRCGDGEQAEAIPLPPGSVGDAQGPASFLETGELREVSVGDLRWRVGVVDPLVWARVRHLAD